MWLNSETVRDLIWTIIILWLIWKMVEAFRSLTKTSGQQNSPINRIIKNTYTTQNDGKINISTTDKTSKPLVKPDQGEYVDYEEVNP